MKSVLIADDHAIVRTGISVLVRDEFQNAEIEECSDGNGVLKKMRSKKYDLIILDISMPGLDSVSLLKNIFSHFQDQKVLILSMSSEAIYAEKYLSLGAKGYINKEANSLELRRALNTVMSNKRYLSQRMADMLLEGTPASPFSTLSARELEVLTHLLDGKNVTEIAGILCIHTSTAGTHKARIMEKVGVSNLMELNKMAQLFSIK